MFDAASAIAFASHETFLAEENDREKVMDRLHAYCYFLEALLFTSDAARRWLRGSIAWDNSCARSRPSFERSDVNAQLLRVRLVAHHPGIVRWMRPRRGKKPRAPRLSRRWKPPTCGLRGGFWFGRKGEQMLPFSNPVSTAFCLQALALWDDHQAGRWSFELPQLI